MTRKKVKLAFITNDSARKATFKKRKKGLMKKVSELSTLCGIDVCAVIYSPYESQPEVWPSTLGAQRVIAQFKRMPEMEQSKKMVNQESFVRQRIAKANEQLKKQGKDNREKEITQLMYQCLTGKGLQSLDMADLNDLGWLLDQKLKEIYKRIESLKKNVAAGPPPVAPPQEQKPPGAADGLGGGDVGGVHRTNWFADWMSNPSDHHQGMGGGGGFGGHHGGEDQMIMPFHDNQNPMWSSAFFP